MPVNGSAAHLPLDPEPGSTPAAPAVTPAELDSVIGEAAARAAATLCQALEEHFAGGLKTATRDAGADRIAWLWELQAAVGSRTDFADIVQREGKLVLQQYLDAEFYRHHTADQGDAMIEGILSEVLGILAGVTAIERAAAH